MTGFATIAVERRGSVGVVTLNRPEKKNALSIRMRREISALLAAWRDDLSIRVVIITGAGNAFCAGFDLQEFREPKLFADIFVSSSRYHRDLARFPKPLIAAVNGPAMGGGFDLALLCDIRIGSAAARFGHPEIRFGAPPLFTPLRRVVGDGPGRELTLTGRTVQAEEALRIGLLSEIVPTEELAARAGAIALAIAASPVAAVERTKTFFEPNGFEEWFEREHDAPFRELLDPALFAKS